MGLIAVIEQELIPCRIGIHIAAIVRLEWRQRDFAKPDVLRIDWIRLWLYSLGL